MDKICLKVSNASHYFSKENLLFQNLSFEVKEGEILAILGPNGQGKSTLVSAIAGGLKLNQGEIFAPSNIAFVPQSFQVSLDFSVLDIVLMGRCKEISFFSSPSKQDEEKAYESLCMLGIENLAKRIFNNLSGGQRQLVLLARAIASWSELIILDEPASALDLHNQDKILNVIAMLRKKYNQSIIFTTHQPNHALAIADKTLMMMHDLSYKIGSNEEVMSKKNLSKLYGLNIELLDITWKEKLLQSATPIFSNQLK